MERLIIQQDRRHGRMSEFVKSSDETLTLGRGFNNDVILSDHFIAAEQIRFYYEQGQWQLKILDDTNPVLLNNKPVSKDSIAVKSGDKLVVGRTHLVLLLSNHPLEHTRKLMLSNWMYHNVLRLLIPFAMLLVSTLLAVFTEYQQISGKILWRPLIASGLAYVSLVAIWAGCWALIGRLLGHKPNFLAQLFYTALMMAGLNIGSLFSGYAEYATTSSIFGYIVEWGFMLIILGMLLKFNLNYATELKKRGVISFSVVAVVMLFTFLMQHLEQRDFNAHPVYSGTLKPPFMKWSSDKPVEVYMQDVASQFEELEDILDSEGKGD